MQFRLKHICLVVSVASLALSLAFLSALCLSVGAAWAGEESAVAEVAWPAATETTRPWAYWWWMGSAVDRQNITSQLETFHEAGVGGVHIIPIYGAKGYEDRYIEFLSPEWMAMLGHSVREARRLGMGVDMTTGTGWCFGGPNISDELANAYVEHEVRPLESGSSTEETFDRPLQAIVAYAEDGRCIDLKGRVNEEGQFQWTVPDGQWQLLTVWQKPMRYVKRAAPGGAGWMLNTFDRKAIDTYLERFTEAFDAYDGPLPRAQYHDSYEYQCNWSPNLFGEFERRRGYPLQDRLPELFELAGTDETQNRVRADYQRTLNDLMLSDFLKPWTEWSRHRGMVTRNQAHGSPGNLLDLYAVADIPEAEMFRQDRDPLVAKFASSAAHVAGRQLVSSETGTWLRDHYHVTLGDLKRLVDDFFTSGINHIIYHGNCYSPAEAPWPGWTFYAATQMNPRNTIWHDVPTLNAYITRCQSILQAGRPDNDVLVYWPIEDLWHATGELAPQLTVHHTEWLTRQPIGKTARRLWDRGYAFDYISDRLLEKASSDESGRIVTPGAQYRVLVVPPCQHMPLATLKKLLVLAEQGATIIFEDKLPTDVPGLAKLDMRRVKLEAMLAPLAPTEWSDGKSPRSIAVGQGTVWIGDLEPALEAAGTPREAMADLGIEFIRRSTETGKDYFVVNLGKEPIDTWVPLAVEAKSVVVMDPMTGKVGLGAVRGQRPEVGDHGEVQGSGFRVQALR